MTLRVRTKLFIAAFSVGAVTAVAAGSLMVWSLRARTVTRIEQTLTANTRLVTELLSNSGGAAAPHDLDAEADRLGELAGVRVTFIGIDGRVLGDSAEDDAALDAMEDHLHRPEIAAARQAQRLILQRRYSTTTDYDTLYAAAPVTHPSVGYVRLAVPLREIADQQRAILLLTFGGVLASLPIAALLAWLLSAPVARRVAAIATVARRYAAGDLTQPVGGYGDDELGEVARALDAAAQELGQRVHELATDRRHLQAILAGMVEGVAVMDAQGRLVMANEAARAMLRLDDDARGRRYQEWIRQPELFAPLAAALRGEAPAGVEFVLARDPSRTCIARAAPAGGQAAGAVLVVHDITDLRRADRVRRDFVANVSHELRTPLTAIRGYVEALQDDPPPEDSRRFLEIIARHTNRMERLVKDLLRLARLDAGQETRELVACDLPGVLNGVVNELAPAIEARRSRIALTVPSEMTTIVSDPAKLHDVMRNLIENAVHYSPEGTVVEVDARRDGAAAVLRVRDAGPGIPQADLTRVFERFYRVDKSRARDPGGTGIGLAIVRHLVELLGGDVSAANRPEGGAVFTVRLPQEAPR